MKILSGKYDEVMKRKAEYDAEQEVLKKEYDNQEHEYYKAQDRVFQPIRDYLEENLKKFDLLTFEVRVQSGLYRGIEVRILCNEYNKFEDNSALSWNYSAEIRDDQLYRETGSWSGLKALTPDQMESLRQSVAALEFLNSLDWDEIVHRELPKFRDYVTMDDPRYGRKNFKNELVEAKIADSMGQRVFLVADDSMGYLFLNESPSFYTVFAYPTYYLKDSGYRESLSAKVDEALEKGSSDYTKRVKKDKILPLIKQPFEEIEV